MCSRQLFSLADSHCLRLCRRSSSTVVIDVFKYLDELSGILIGFTVGIVCHITDFQSVNTSDFFCASLSVQAYSRTPMTDVELIIFFLEYCSYVRHRTLKDKWQQSNKLLENAVSRCEDKISIALDKKKTKLASVIIDKQSMLTSK